MAFAERGAKRYTRIARGRYSYDELRSAAYVGLIVAARQFDPARGVKFTTYAFNWIDHHLRYHHATDKMQTGWSRDASNAEKLEGKTGQQRRVYIGQFPDKENKHGDPILFDPVGESPDYVDDLMQREQRDFVLSQAKTERERDILVRRMRGDTHREIGKALGVSGARIHQIDLKLMARIKRAALRHEALLNDN